MEPPVSTKRFRVALSFPGEYRGRIERIAEALAAALGRDRVLYDKWYAAEFARPGLGAYLPELYQKESDLLIFFFARSTGTRSGPGSNGAQLSIFSKRNSMAG
jgi:hypothetical protein